MVLQAECQGAVGSVSSDYRPKHSFGKASPDYDWLFEQDGTGRYRLRAEPLPD